MSLKLRVSSSAVFPKTISDALRLRWDTQKSYLVKLRTGPITGGEFAISFDVLTSWLAGVKRVADAQTLSDFKTLLVPFILSCQTKLVVPSTKETPIIVSQAFEASDYFRKDASTGAKRLQPVVIDSIAKSGTLDIYVRPPPNIWNQKPCDIQRVSVDLASSYRPQALQQYRRANPEVLVGPQMAEVYPQHPLSTRRILAPMLFVRNEGLTTLPASESRFSWEAA